MIAENQTPLPLVREWTNLIPNLWEDFAELAKRVPQVEPELADDAELAAALSIVQKRSAPNVPAFAKVNAAYELHALAIWRTHKIVYAYDSALAAELIEQADAWSDADELPVEALLHPPYKLPFISSPGMISEDFIGFFSVYHARRRYQRGDFVPDMGIHRAGFGDADAQAVGQNHRRLHPSDHPPSKCSQAR